MEILILTFGILILLTMPEVVWALVVMFVTFTVSIPALFLLLIVKTGAAIKQFMNRLMS